MYCPFMRGSQYNSIGQCETEFCALWDNQKDQCCIKTMALKEPPDPIQTIVNQSYDKDAWIDSFIRSELK